MTQEKINRLLEIVNEYARMSGTTSRMVDEAKAILQAEVMDKYNLRNAVHELLQLADDSAFIDLADLKSTAISHKLRELSCYTYQKAK